LTIFVDTSVWFAAAVTRDHGNRVAKTILREADELLTSDHVLIETWLLLKGRGGRYVAEQFWDGLRRGAARLEIVSAADLDAAWRIGEGFRDQDFSLVDRTSFALMERLGITTAASFDDDFAVYRYGRARDKAFDVLR
jgi:predicted nucleic acid-binding protein